jgi:predicted XRE-type DNA-binding protein
VSESEFEQIRAIPDLADRAKAVLDAQDRHRQAISTLSAMRREIIDAMRASGLRPADIAKQLGVTRSRMSQLMTAVGPGPERAFLGDGRLTIVVGQKPVHGNHNIKGPGVALETLNAHDRLKELAATYQLETDREEVPQPGFFDLNRDNLIVMAGPRLFPMVGQILDGDPDLRFEVDADGEWSLHDLNTGEVHRPTPRDADNKPVTDGPARDFGYLGRLPRPDGKGTFLCLAGIHATGTQGVAAHIEAALPQLYAEVKTRRFSMAIECEYDPENNNTVTAAKPASPIYKRS